MTARDHLGSLFEAASAARERAYAPYSRFSVGAAIRAEDDRIFSGCNVENAAYPVGTCAEAGAIAAMVAGGARRIVEILIVGAAPDGLAPCGACRQRIAEFALPAALIHLAGSSGIRHTVTVAELLPLAFGPHSLP